MIGPNVCRKKVLLFCIKTLKFALFSNNNESRRIKRAKTFAFNRT